MVSQKRIIGLAPGQRKFRILVVDNLYSSRDALTLMLSNIGFHPREAINGEEAIAIVEQWHPDVILIDAMLPGIDGNEATRRIKALPDGKKSAVIIISANATDVEKQEALESGADDFIRKPFREVDLFEKLRKVVGVEYIQEEPRIQKEKVLPHAIRRESIHNIPQNYLSDMRKAVDDGDMAQLMKLIDQMAQHDKIFAENLRDLAEQHQFSALRSLL